MFLRKKKVKNKEYLYAVENSWNKGIVKQKVKRYLGRVHKLEEIRKVSFSAFIKQKEKLDLEGYLNLIDSDSLVYDLVKWELYRRGFKIKKENAQKGLLDVDFTKRLKILNQKKRPFCIECKNGYINNLSINMILNAKSREEGDIDKKKEALGFAKIILEGGINIPQEVFIELFGMKFIDVEKEKNINEEIKY